MVIKRVFIFVLMTLGLSSLLFAQDLIILRDGTEIFSKVISVDISSVVYKKQSNLDGPSYTIGKDEIFMIKYQNGEKDVFKEQTHQKENNGGNALSPTVVRKAPSSRNAEILARYNKLYTLSDGEDGKKTKAVFYSLGISESSVMANEDIEILFNTKMDAQRTGVNEAVKGDIYINKEEGDLIYDLNVFQRHDGGVFQVVVKNVSDRMVYIDRGNCFKIENEDQAISYYDNSQHTISSGNSTGAGLGLGSVANVLGVGGAVGTIANGVTVGASSTRGTATSYSSERIVAIPPHSTKVLSEPKWIKVHGATLTSHGKYENVGGHYEFQPHGFMRLSYPLRQNECIVYDETNSPFIRRYVITYSTEPDFRNYGIMEIKQYLHQIVGAKGYGKGQIDDADEYTIGSVVRYDY